MSNSIVLFSKWAKNVLWILITWHKNAHKHFKSSTIYVLDQLNALPCVYSFGILFDVFDCGLLDNNYGICFKAFYWIASMTANSGGANNKKKKTKFVQTNFHAPYLCQWNQEIDRSLARSLVISLHKHGVRVFHLIRFL